MNNVINKLFEKVNIVLVMRCAGLFLFALFLLQAGMNATRGAGVDNMVLIFIVTLANGLFQPLVLIGLAEIINCKKNKA